MKNKILKIIWSVIIIFQIIVFIFDRLGILYHWYDTYFNTNYLVFCIIELINITFGFFILKQKENTHRRLRILYLIFIIIIFFIPVYEYGNTFAPSWTNSELMGLGVKRRYLNVYGINIFTQ